MAADHDVIEALGAKLALDAVEMEESAAYYEASYRLKTIGMSTPVEMRCLTAAIGWPRLYLDAIEERLDIEGFRLAESADQLKDLADWWQANDLDEESGLGHLDAMIHGRAYITVSEDPEDASIPMIRVESARHMIHETDPRTRQVTKALRLYKSQEFPDQDRATLYLPDATLFYTRGNDGWVRDGEAVEHGLGVVPVVPLLNRERLADRRGTSEIMPELRSFTDAAARAFMNMQAASELMAVPQRLLFGVDPETLAPNGTPAEVLNAYMANILAFEDPDGKAMSFSPAELRNFTEILEQLAKHVASYTGLPPQYLSFASDNPASAEAIKSSESRLVKKCERKGRMFGGSWERAMRIAKRMVDGKWDPELRKLETRWRDPSTPTFSAKADAVTKLYANGSGVIPKRRARIDLDYTSTEIEQMDKWDEEEAKKKSDAEFQNALDNFVGSTKEPDAGQVPAKQLPDAIDE